MMITCKILEKNTDVSQFCRHLKFWWRHQKKCQNGYIFWTVHFQTMILIWKMLSFLCSFQRAQFQDDTTTLILAYFFKKWSRDPPPWTWEFRKLHAPLDFIHTCESWSSYLQQFLSSSIFSTGGVYNLPLSPLTVNQHILKMLYYILVYSHFTYTIETWG